MLSSLTRVTRACWHYCLVVVHLGIPLFSPLPEAGSKQGVTFPASHKEPTSQGVQSQMATAAQTQFIQMVKWLMLIVTPVCGVLPLPAVLVLQLPSAVRYYCSINLRSLFVASPRSLLVPSAQLLVLIMV